MLVNRRRPCADRQKISTNIGSDGESGSSLFKSCSLSEFVDIVVGRHNDPGMTGLAECWDWDKQW